MIVLALAYLRCHDSMRLGAFGAKPFLALLLRLFPRVADYDHESPLDFGHGSLYGFLWWSGG